MNLIYAFNNGEPTSSGIGDARVLRCTACVLSCCSIELVINEMSIPVGYQSQQHTSQQTVRPMGHSLQTTAQGHHP
ncbi:unnamed protein product, partial [Brugia timori]